MARINFYEKPGCLNNTMQKKILRNAGHEVIEHNLLTEPWTPGRLRPFFASKQVAEWFNRSAPRVKSGEIVPESIDADRALALMIEDPLLIRRPLMATESLYPAASMLKRSHPCSAWQLRRLPVTWRAAHRPTHRAACRRRSRHR